MRTESNGVALRGEQAHAGPERNGYDDSSRNTLKHARRENLAGDAKGNGASGSNREAESTECESILSGSVRGSM